MKAVFEHAYGMKLDEEDIRRLELHKESIYTKDGLENVYTLEIVDLFDFQYLIDKYDEVIISKRTLISGEKLTSIMVYDQS